MTELEKTEYAKLFIDKLANGINPLDDTVIPDGDIVNNVRLSRCFFYVSDILRQVIENGGVGKRKKPPQEPFTLTREEIERFKYSQLPISMTVLARKIYEAANNEKMEKFSYKIIREWLFSIGMLEVKYNEEGKARHLPTPEGESIGILAEPRETRYGRKYIAVLYKEEAQRFVLDNFEAMMSWSENAPPQADDDDAYSDN